MACCRTVNCSPAPKTIGCERLGSLLGAPEQLADLAARTLSAIPTDSAVAGLGKGTHSGVGNFARPGYNPWPTGGKQRLSLVMAEAPSLGHANRPWPLQQGRKLRAALSRQRVPPPMAVAPRPR